MAGAPAPGQFQSETHVLEQGGGGRAPRPGLPRKRWRNPRTVAFAAAWVATMVIVFFVTRSIDRPSDSTDNRPGVTTGRSGSASGEGRGGGASGGAGAGGGQAGAGTPAGVTGAPGDPGATAGAPVLPPDLANSAIGGGTARGMADTSGEDGTTGALDGGLSTDQSGLPGLETANPSTDPTDSSAADEQDESSDDDSGLSESSGGGAGERDASGVAGGVDTTS